MIYPLVGDNTTIKVSCPCQNRLPDIVTSTVQSNTILRRVISKYGLRHFEASALSALWYKPLPHFRPSDMAVVIDCGVTAGVARDCLLVVSKTTH